MGTAGTREVAEKRFKLSWSEANRSTATWTNRSAPCSPPVEQSIFDGQRLLRGTDAAAADGVATLRQLATRAGALQPGPQLLRGYFAHARAGAARFGPRALYQQAWIDESCRNFAGLHNVTTAPQRHQRCGGLRAYQRDLGDSHAR